MTYQVFARKWRPQKFADVAGHQTVLRALQHALRTEQLHHAYLLTGTRGVGKTTLARLIAKSVNCEQGISEEPCGVCQTCQDIAAGICVDVLEIDAASRTKVEDTRELLDNVIYAPTRARFKIYIIDEVHMLSTHSFNALLKTLEEPPAHVKFLLATTDPQRLPMTILSRCLQFHLKTLPVSIIVQKIQDILQQEQIVFEAGALDVIAESAQGSLRDALSLLEQVCAEGQGQVLLENTYALLGRLDPNVCLDLLGALQHQDVYAACQKIREWADQDVDFDAMLQMLMHAIHDLVCLQLAPKMLDNHPKLSVYQQMVRVWTPQQLQLMYQIVLNGRKDLPFASSGQLGFEMVVLRMLAFGEKILPNPPLGKEGVVERENVVVVGQILPNPPLEKEGIEARENVVVVEKTLPSPPLEKKGVETRENVVVVEKILPSPPLEKEGAGGGVDWAVLLPQLGLQGVTYALAAQCVIKEHSENKIVLALLPKHAVMWNVHQAKVLVEALTKYFKKPYHVDVKVENHQIITPAAQLSAEKVAEQQAVMAELKDDPHIQTMLKTFDVTLDPQSVIVK